MYDKNDLQYFERSFVRDPGRHYKSYSRMNTNHNYGHSPLVYTPRITAEASAAIRRLSWSSKKPMTKTLNALIMALPAIIEKSKICLSCHDKEDCIFKRYYTAADKENLLSAL